MPDHHTPFRVVAPSMRTLAIVLWAVAVGLLPLAALTEGSRALLFAIAPSVFIALFAWVVLWRPEVSASDEALVVRDVRRTTTIDWRRVVEVQSRHGLEIVTSEGVRRTWIAPRGSARLRLELLRDGSRGPADGSERPGGTEQVTVQDAAARLVGFVPEPESAEGPPPAQVVAAPIVQRIHWSAVLGLIVLGIAASLSGARI